MAKIIECKFICHWYFNVPPVKLVQNKGKMGIPDVGKNVVWSPE